MITLTAVPVGSSHHINKKILFTCTTLNHKIVHALLATVFKYFKGLLSHSKVVHLHFCTQATDRSFTYPRHDSLSTQKTALEHTIRTAANFFNITIYMYC